MSLDKSDIDKIAWLARLSTCVEPHGTQTNTLGLGLNMVSPWAW